MTGRDEVPRSTDPSLHGADPDRERAQAVHSVDDETRVHAGGDETETLQGAGGDVLRPASSDRGGHMPDDGENDGGQPLRAVV